MSQTSSTPGRVQHQSLLEEIQRLKKALEKAQDKQKLFEECWEGERAENRTLKIDNEELRSLETTDNWAVSHSKATKRMVDLVELGIREGFSDNSVVPPFAALGSRSLIIGTKAPLESGAGGDLATVTQDLWAEWRARWLC